MLCDKKSEMPYDICVHCYQKLPWIKHGCERCGQVISDSAPLCGQCITSPPLHQRLYVPFEYKEDIKKLISDLKFSQKLSPALLLGQLMSDHLQLLYRQNGLPEAILPVPLHSHRLASRGFNQAIELSRPIALNLSLPIIRKSIIRSKNTEPQSTLSANHRSKNIHHAFQMTSPLPYQKIAILDDVYTTGETINELCKCLLQIQSIHIDVWCISRAKMH